MFMEVDADILHGLAPFVETAGLELLQTHGLPRVQGSGHFGSASVLIVSPNAARCEGMPHLSVTSFARQNP